MQVNIARFSVNAEQKIKQKAKKNQRGACRASVNGALRVLSLLYVSFELNFMCKTCNNLFPFKYNLFLDYYRPPNPIEYLAAYLLKNKEEHKSGVAKE